MGVRVPYDKLKQDVKQIFLNLGLTEEKAEICTAVHIQSSADGVESHGLNRIPRFVEYVQKGWVNIKGEPQLAGAKGVVENYDGQLGIGITNALFCADRAVELAKKHGIGCVALKNTTHWMRGATYVWKMAEAGFMGMSWINAESCMPLWGSDKRSVGNNPFCMAIPREDGPLILDMAMSLYAYGKLGVYRLAGKQLPYPGGFDKDGNLTCDPGAIEETMRGLPMGYWKGSGISIALDLIATVLTNGNSVSRIGTFGDEVGLSQIMIAIDPLRFNTPEETDSIVDEILADIKSSEPIREGGEVYYPGELELKNIKENKEQGIPVIEEVWESILKM